MGSLWARLFLYPLKTVPLCDSKIPLFLLRGSFTRLHLDAYPSYTKGPSTFAPVPCVPHPLPNLRYTLILLFPRLYPISP